MRDIDIRRALRKEMLTAHRAEPDTLIVEELGLCQGIARVDLAVVNGTVHGYEIKSEQDTLARLPGQIEVYSRTLEFVTVATAENHVRNVRKLVPKWWGIWSAVPTKDGVQLAVDRSSRPNPCVDPFALAQLLWRDEALAVLAQHGLDSGMRSKRRQELWRKLATTLEVKELADVIRECLKHRGIEWRDPLPQA